MEKLKLNETPKRTSKNYGINNIVLENVHIPEQIKEFNNCYVRRGSNVDLQSDLEKANFKYGVGEAVVSQAKNKNIKIVCDKTENEIQLNFVFDEENTSLVENIEIIAEEKSNNTIILKYESKQDEEAYHNGIIRLIAKENSNINVIIVNMLNEKSNNFISIQNEIEKSAKVNYTIIELGAKNSVSNYFSNIMGDEAKNSLNTIYLGKENQVFDLNYIAELSGKKTNVNIEVQGALKDNAKKHFKGTIDFKKGAKKAVGNENEFCMLLSDTAKSIALPMLLCTEDDVEGNHSTAAGKIDEKQLFYIMSRGFSIKEAMKLIVKSRFNKILENVKNEDLKDEILSNIDRRLD